MQSGLASPRKSKIDEALELALDARNKLIDSRPDLASLLRACNTISILLGKEEEFKWIKYELNGYPKDASIPDYRNVLGHFLDDSEESIETPVKLRRYAISVPAWRILDLSRSRRGLVLTPSTKQIKDVEREAETTPEEFVVTPTTLKYLLNSLTNSLLEHVTKVALELQYSGIPASILEERRIMVDEKLVDISPDATEKLQAAYELLARGKTDENWSQVALECRRIMKDVADVLFPPRKEPHVDKSDVEREVGSEQFVNRLLAFVDQEAKGSNRQMVTAETEHLGSLLDKVQDLASGGIHGNVTKAEAKTCVIYTYLLLGDIVGLREVNAPAEAQ